MNRIEGCSATQPDRKMLMIMRGPSVKIGADAALAPADHPPVSVSRITIVSRGPGRIPSNIPRATPAAARANMRSVCIF